MKSPGGHDASSQECGGMRSTRSPRACTMAIFTATLVVLAALSVAPASAIGNNSGLWGPRIRFGGVIPIAATVTTGNKLVVWSADDKVGLDFSGSTWTATLDLATGDVSTNQVFVGHNMFCPGTAVLPDGRILVNGGATELATSFYDPKIDRWVRGPEMNIERGYNSDVLMPDGRVFTLGGSWSGPRGGKNGEIWSAATGWRDLPGASADVILTEDPEGIFRDDNHPWLFAVGGNTVFHAGPSKQMNFFDVSGNGSSVPAGLRALDEHSMNGNAVMYAPNKILTLGGSQAYNDRDYPATSNAHVITLQGRTVNVRKVASMRFRRTFHNSVLLPDGTVLVLGGQKFPKQFEDYFPVLTPELWNPVTETFRSLAPSPTARTYHSVAILLPDGRVFSGGGGGCNPDIQSYCPKNDNKVPNPDNHPNGEIFTPPYLLNADGTPATRPAIVTAPATARYGRTITVRTNRPVTKFVLMRLSAVTHSINNDMRRVAITPKVTGTNTYSLRMPRSKVTAPPGPYHLFALNANDVPSVSRFIQLT